MAEAIILAGGSGRRLTHYLTRGGPKSMVTVAGAPLIWYLLTWLESQSAITRVLLAVGHRMEDIRDYIADGREWSKPIVLIEEHSRLGRGGAIKNALRNRLEADEEPVVVINGDIITNLDLAPMITDHKQTGATVTILVSQVRNNWGVVTSADNGWATSYEEKPLQPCLINVGVYVLTPHQKLLLRLPERGDWEDDFLPKIAAEGKLRAYQDASCFWATIDNPRDIFDTEERLQEFIRVGLFGPLT
jgi:mannose-1-phosphate guanylyltransferase